TDEKTYELIENLDEQDLFEKNKELSHYETIEEVEKLTKTEISNSKQEKEIELGIKKFVDWLKNGKLEIRVYPSKNIHSKLYIITFKEGDRDIGRVITGSSNFTKSGLMDNLEFNVELKNSADYEFAKKKFEELWKDSVDVTERFVEIITEKTWLNETITPYELFLKFLYEYFKNELSQVEETENEYLPDDFKEFDYQKQAVLNAKKILDEYGGCFLSDVVGLGKTYMAAMLAKKLQGRILVIAPPSLLNKNNPGSWRNVFLDFNINATFVSSGDLYDGIYQTEQRKYENVIIDEAHKFRNEITQGYEKLSEICSGKKVILVSATPFNNSPEDLLSLIKLFQPARKSNIPGLPNLESFFRKKENELKKLRNKNNELYLKKVKEVSKEIREKVLKYIMVRRTRIEIEKYFADDLLKNNVKFPTVEKPRPVFYQLNDEEDKIFMNTVELITKRLNYTRYQPLLDLKESLPSIEQQSQINMGNFMKILLVKRLESSFFAFKKSIDRFINSYELFIKSFKNGYVYVSKKYSNKIMELFEEGDDEQIQKLIDEGKAERYKSEDFKDGFLKKLENDLKILQEIKQMWAGINRDPKIDTFLKQIKNEPLLKKNKLIIFTESKETAEYLTEKINNEFGETALLFHGQSKENIRFKVIENFDARAKDQKDDYRILVSTEVLSEGVNLHRSNVVINYDIPWNPTKLIQRVGRVNRIDTKFDKIYIFNFFPTKQADTEIELTNIARSKIEAFLTLLGGDSAILTESETVTSHELFDKLLSQEIFEKEDEEDESELKYFRIIENIRDEKPEIFERIKELPIQARSSKIYLESPDSLITFFKKGNLMKFFFSDKNKTTELDFTSAAKILESSPEEKRKKIPLENFYEMLMKNDESFIKSTLEEVVERKSGSDNSEKLIKILKATQKNNRQLTEEQEDYLKEVILTLDKGSLPKKTIKNVLKNLEKLGKEINNPLKVLQVLKNTIPSRLLNKENSLNKDNKKEKRKIILSLYLSGESNG
ncbi:MAG: helicase-related protein, partial [candidate division WOR-3 bacterium]